MKAVQEIGEIDLQCGHPNCVNNGTYRLKARCHNCSWQGTALLTKGHKAPYSATCPHCKCDTVYVHS